MDSYLEIISFKINTLLYKYLGFRITKALPFGHALMATDQKAFKIVDGVRERTMTSENSLINLIVATRYIVANDIPGDFVECGVWRGGSMIAIANTLNDLKIDDRCLYLYDTYNGMTAPSPIDIDIKGMSAESFLKNPQDLTNNDYQSGVVAYATLADVTEGMVGTNYPRDLIHFIKGDVMQTLSTPLHEHIGLLRLDTDWYESTKFELNQLWDKISIGGILIVDDYDYWNGSKVAVDEFFSARNILPLMMKLDSGGRMIVKMKL